MFDQQEQIPERPQTAQFSQINKHYEIIRCIAQGAFGKVFQCVDGNQHFAVKVIDKNSVKRSKIDFLRSEAKILSSIKHQNIVRMKKMVQTDRNIYLQMELIQHGTLGKLIRDRSQKDPLTVQEISCIMNSILRGVSHLHSLNIIHRDIKPCMFFQYYIAENILVADLKDFSTIKIADFGLSIKVDFNSHKPSDHCGTLFYMAPEVIKKHPYTKSVDIWSCAIIMYMLFSQGHHPLVASKHRYSADEYLEELKKPWPKLKDEMAQNLLEKISKLQTIERYSAAEALKHPFLTQNPADVVPLTYNESFQGFQTDNKVSQIVRLSLILSHMFSRDHKIIIEKGYIQRVDEYNTLAIENRQRIEQIRRASKKKIVSAEDVRQIFAGYSHKVTQASIQSDSPKRIENKATRISNMLNFSFISHLDDCIKIKDLKQESELGTKSVKVQLKDLKNYHTVVKPSQTNNNKVHEFLTNSSFVNIKNAKQKKSIINLPKIIDYNNNNKEKLDLSKLNQERNKSESPKKRLISSRKYVRRETMNPPETMIRLFSKKG